MELEFTVKDNQFFNIKEIIKSQFQISDRLLVKLKREKRIFLNDKSVYVTEKVKARRYFKNWYELYWNFR